MSRPNDSSRDLGRTLRNEPLLHFLGIAALLFGASTLFSTDEREVISVDIATQEYLIQQQQDLLLRDMTDSEKRQAIESFIDDEILVREARKRGFENSSRIRTLLTQNMRFFITGNLPEPTDADLRAYFDANIERFETRPSVTFDHVIFNDPGAIAADTLSLLRDGADHRTVGDTSPMTARLIKLNERQIVASFGRTEAPRVLAIDDDRWHGPFTSLGGAHFLRITERHPGTRPTFEDAQTWIRQDWQLTKSREAVERELLAMRENYRIDVEKPQPQS